MEIEGHENRHGAVVPTGDMMLFDRTAALADCHMLCAESHPPIAVENDGIGFSAYFAGGAVG
jgi:hypothetical protein